MNRKLIKLKHGKEKRRRTQDEVTSDFQDCCFFITQGYTWTEVFNAIAPERPYLLDMQALKASYGREMRKLARATSAEDARERAIEDLDAIMSKMIMAYNNSVSMNKRVTKTEGTGGEGGSYESTVISKMKSYGDTKYLNTYLTAFNKKCSLMGWDKPQELSITHILKDAIIDDGASIVQPIRSEEEAKDFGDTIEIPLRDDI